MVGPHEDDVLLEPLRRLPAVRRLASGPATRSELQERLDVSRATLHRVVTTLTEADLAVETDDGVELTAFGREVAEASDAYAERVAAAERVAPLLNAIEPDDVAVEVPPAVFADAEVIQPAPSRPQRPVQRVLELIRSADRLRTLAPVVMPSYVETAREAVLAGTDLDMVVDPTVLAGLEEDYAEAVADAAGTGRVTVHRHGSLPMALMIADRTVLVIAHDEEGVLKGAVEGDGERLRSWAENCFEHFREAAEAGALGGWVDGANEGAES